MPTKIIELSQKAIIIETNPTMIPYHIGFKILNNVQEYLLELNPAPLGRLSWTKQFYKQWESNDEDIF